MKSIHRLFLPGWGSILITLTSAGISRIEIGNDFRRKSSSHRYLKVIKEYLTGKEKKLNLPIDLQEGTPFQRAVWRAISRIPYGETRSYGWIAKRIKRPKAVRAVGQACGANPVPLFIPCHRVIAADGSLGGFSSGPGWKRRLLALENAIK